MPPKTRVQKCVKIAKNGHFRPFFFGNFRKFSEIPEISGKFSPDFPPDFPVGYPAPQSGFLKKHGKFSPEFSPIFRGVFRGIFPRNFRRFLSKKWQKWPKITKILGCVPCSAKRVLQNTRIFPKSGENFLKFPKFPEKFSRKFPPEKFSRKSSVGFSGFSYFSKIFPGISPENVPILRGVTLRCRRETPKKPEKIPRFSPGNFLGISRGKFSGNFPEFVRNSREIPHDFTRVTRLYKAVFGKTPPNFPGIFPREFPGNSGKFREIFLGGVCRKKFPPFSKNFLKFSRRTIFDNFRKFSWQNFFWKVSQIFLTDFFIMFWK